MIIRRTYLVILAVFLCACTEETIISETIQTRQNDWSLISVNFPKSDFIWDLTVSLDGAIWLAASNGVWRLDGQSWKVFTTQDGLPTNASFMGIASNSQGDVVVAACPGGVYRFENEKWVLFTHEMPVIFQQICVWGLYLQDDGRLWMGVVNPEMGSFPGLGVIFFDGQRWHIYYPDEIDWNGTKTEKVDIPFTDVINILPGLGDRVWFETNAGISSYDSKTWISYSYSDVLGVAPSTDEDAVHKQNGLVGMTVASDGAVWVGTGKGIARLNNFIWTHYKLPSSSEGAHLFPLVAGSDGTVWFYASGQLLRFDGNNWWNYSLPSEFEFSFRWLAAVGPDQSLWLGSQKMIVRYLPGGTPIKTEISIPATPVSP